LRRGKFALESAVQDHVPLLFIVRVVIESALLYTCASIFAFLTAVIHTNVEYTAAAFVSPAVIFPVVD
jgi:hypothetical protein